LGEAVVKSNMEVMTQGFERVREIKVGELSAPDRSTLRGQALLPMAAPLIADGGGNGHSCGCRSHDAPEGQLDRTPFTRAKEVDDLFRGGVRDNQPPDTHP